MFCSKCGHDIGDKPKKFCEYCGAYLSNNSMTVNSVFTNNQSKSTATDTIINNKEPENLYTRHIQEKAKKYLCSPLLLIVSIMYVLVLALKLLYLYTSVDGFWLQTTLKILGLIPNENTAFINFGLTVYSIVAEFLLSASLWTLYFCAKLDKGYNILSRAVSFLKLSVIIKAIGILLSELQIVYEIFFLMKLYRVVGYNDLVVYSIIEIAFNVIILSLYTIAVVLAMHSLSRIKKNVSGVNTNKRIPLSFAVFAFIFAYLYFISSPLFLNGETFVYCGNCLLLACSYLALGIWILMYRSGINKRKRCVIVNPMKLVVPQTYRTEPEATTLFAEVNTNINV